MILLYLGETKENNKGSLMKIIKIVNSSCIDIEFQDSHHYVRQTTYNNFKTGGISNPYFPTVCNIGYHGVGKFATNNNCVEYVPRCLPLYEASKLPDLAMSIPFGNPLLFGLFINNIFIF